MHSWLKRGRQRVLEDYTQERIAEQIHESYLEMPGRFS